MPPLESRVAVHPPGESTLEQLGWPVDTPGGRYFAEFDDEAPVTREGQLIFCAQFLHTGGRWERFLKNSPLAYTGKRGSKVVDVLGTAALSILCGHWRYAHINAVRRPAQPAAARDGRDGERRRGARRVAAPGGNRGPGVARGRTARVRRAGLEPAVDPGHRRDGQDD